MKMMIGNQINKILATFTVAEIFSHNKLTISRKIWDESPVYIDRN